MKGSVPISADCTGVKGFWPVEDAGIGIPVQDLPFVFEPFYRVDKARTRETGGYGLVQSLVKSIAEAHGGEASIESVEARGARVNAPSSQNTAGRYRALLRPILNLLP